MLQYWRVYAMLLVLLGFGAMKLYGIFSNAGYGPTQPIAFSHALHAGALQIDCLYCHTNAEQAAHATVPPMSTCMGCHSVVKVNNSPLIKQLETAYAEGKPIEWVRIHRMPDHAHFSHQWHVAAGVACQTCHGPVEKMAVVAQNIKLEMKECMVCHRQSTYTDNINHPPSYTAGFEDGHIGDGQLESLKKDPGWRTALEATRKYLHPGEKLDEKSVAVNLLASRDIYYHGRGYQLRNKNASVECTTCHH